MSDPLEAVLSLDSHNLEADQIEMVEYLDYSPPDEKLMNIENYDFCGENLEDAFSTSYLEDSCQDEIT